MRKELRVALIGGGGFMGRAHSLAYSLAPIAQDIGACLIKEVLVDLTEEGAREAAESLGWNSSATDWREVIARDDIDIVDIVTPPQFHAEIAIAAMRAGKHVFCEKPISNDLAEAEEMARVATESGVVTQAGFNYRHSSAIAFTRKQLESGRLGAPLQFRGSYQQEGGFTASPERWRAKKASGGSGTAGDIGSHIIDISQYLLGDILEVSALLRAKDPSARSGWLDESTRLDEDLIDDAGVWIAKFASGAIGTFSCSSFSSGRKNSVEFQLDASEGAVEFSWNDREVFRVSYTDEPADHQGFRNIHTSSQHPKGWWRLAGLGTGYVEVSATQIQSFATAIVTGAATAPDFEAAAQVQRVVAALHRSAESGQWVSVNEMSGKYLS